jgi:HD superfamily phosphohydrolase
MGGWLIVRTVFKADEKLRDYAKDILDAHKIVLAEEYRKSLPEDRMERLIDLYISYLDYRVNKEFGEEITDPLYGLVGFTPTVSKILSLPIMNRLRFIRQLSFSYVTYPTANHTRFEHSIGVYYLAKKLSEVPAVNKLLNEELIEAFLIAALLHDLAQGPGSHSLEKIFGGKYDEKKIVEILKSNKNFGLNEVLDSNKINLTTKILPGGEEINPSKDNEAIFTFLREALDSVVDIDRLDYLNRDRYFCGIQSGGVDSLILLKYIKPGYDDKGLRYSFSDDHRAIELINAAITSRIELYPLIYQEERRMAADEAYCHALFSFAYENFPQKWAEILNKIIYLTDYQVISLLMLSSSQYIIEFVNSIFNCDIPYVICYSLNLKESKNASKFWDQLKKLAIDRIVMLEIALCDLIGMQISGPYPRLFIRYPWKGRDPKTEEKNTILINKGRNVVGIEDFSTTRQLLNIMLPTDMNIFFFVDKSYKEKTEQTIRKIFEAEDIANEFLNEIEDITNPSGRLPTFESAKFSDKFKNKLKSAYS